MKHGLFVPLDGSSWSEHALPFATMLARQAQVPLHLAHVHIPIVTEYVESIPIIDPEMDQASRRNDRAYLDAVCDKLTTLAGVRARGTVLDGPVIDTLIDHVHATQADMIVMTTHGRGGLTRLWLGSVADTLVRRSHVPVLVIRPHEAAADLSATPEIKRVLVPLDGSPLAERALEIAIDLSKLTGAELVLLRVVDALIVGSVPMMPRQPIDTYDIVEQRQREAYSYLREWCDRLHTENIPASCKVLIEPAPATAILDELTQANYDLVVMATHGRGGLSRMLIGSVADKVLRGADLPILLYRPDA